MANCAYLFPSSPDSCSGRACFGALTPSSALSEKSELHCDYPQLLKAEEASKRRNTFYQNKNQETSEIKGAAAMSAQKEFQQPSFTLYRKCTDRLRALQLAAVHRCLFYTRRP
ncbi:hypothetical protein AAG570_006635 [Ranatra chinensis]|uniref:Uncharacterized protein n=1 Tax=Ranatra chinensis TaxID=642074 RepID=A0ABD0Z7C1_9HEMI